MYQQLSEINRKIDFRSIEANSGDSFFSSIANPTHKEFLACELRDIAFQTGMNSPEAFSHCLNNQEQYFNVMENLKVEGQWQPEMEYLALGLILEGTGLKVVLLQDATAPLRYDEEEEAITDGHIVIAKKTNSGVSIYYPTRKIEVTRKYNDIILELGKISLLTRV